MSPLQYLFSEEWDVDGNGNWGAAGNWDPASVPNGIGDTATLGSVITAPVTVNTNSTFTVGTINIDNANVYTVSGNQLTLEDTGLVPKITVTNSNGDGAHIISANLAVKDDLLQVTQGSTGALTLSGVISEKGIDKFGTGTLILSGNNTFPSRCFF